jgi:hypothetical protein
MKALLPKNQVRKMLSFIMETIFGKGALGSTKAEKIQIMGSLLQMDNAMSLQNASIYQNWSDIYEYRYEWAEMLRDVNSKFSADDAEKISSDLIEILSNPKNDVDFLGNFFTDEDHIHKTIRDKIVALLYDDKREGAIDYLTSFDPNVDAGSKEFEILKNGLAKELWRDADAAYDILENSELIPSAFFAT